MRVSWLGFSIRMVEAPEEEVHPPRGIREPLTISLGPDGLGPAPHGSEATTRGYPGRMAAPSLADEARKLAPDAIEAFRRHGLTNFAAAIAFYVVLALVPFLLFLLALLGFLDLDEVWRDDVGPEVRDSLSQAAFNLLDDTATRVLTAKQGWWLTGGFVLALWEISAATRVTMTALDRIYGFRRRRSFFELFPRSVALGLTIGAAVVAAVAVVRFLPLLVGDLPGVLSVLFFVFRWLIAAALLGVAVGVFVRFGTATRQPIPWVSFGTSLVMVAWVLMSILYGVYVTYIASYESVFGHLASLIVLLIYVYGSSLVFLAGAQVDACVRERTRR
jgi:membrane protein